MAKHCSYSVEEEWGRSRLKAQLATKSGAGDLSLKSGAFDLLTKLVQVLTNSEYGGGASGRTAGSA